MLCLVVNLGQDFLDNPVKSHLLNAEMTVEKTRAMTSYFSTCSRQDVLAMARKRN